MRRLWITLLLLLLPVMVLAEDETPTLYQCGVYAYTLDEAGNATLMGWRWWKLDEIPAVVAVPATLDGHPVTTLGAYAFNTYEMPAKVSFSLVLPEGVTDCEGDPFLCCHNADVIVFPSTFTGDLEGCFHHVEAEIRVAAGNPTLMVQDGFLIDKQRGTLLYCDLAVKDAPIPAVRRIGGNALSNWGWQCYDTDEDWPEQGKGLTLTIPEGVESIGGWVIYDSVHISRLVLPDSLTTLDAGAFYCTELTEVTFGKGLRRIPEGAFRACYPLEDVVLPETITFVEYNAFDEPVTAMNPDCHFETAEEFFLRTGEDSDYW